MKCFKLITVIWCSLVPEVYKQEASGLQTEAAKLDLMSLITVNIFLLQ